MKKEYDFSKGERGKFYNPDAELKIPVYLEKEVQDFFVELAKKKKIDFQVLVNNTIKANMQLYKAVL
jgi:uncharacterized protein YueI